MWLGMLVAGLLVGLAYPGARAEPPATRPAQTAPDEEWDRALTRTDSWTAGDIGHSMPIPGGRTLWLFGDSFAGPIADGKRVPGETTMVRGAIAWHQTPPDGLPPREIHFALAQPWKEYPVADWARPPEGLWPDGTWYWLMNDGAAVRGEDGGERFVLFTTAIGPAGNPEGMWNFRRIGGAILVVENPHDAPTKWRVEQRRNPLVTETERHGEARRVGENWGLAVVPGRARPGGGGAKDFYVFGIRNDEQGHLSLLLANCSEAALHDPGRWNYFTGKGWSTLPADAAPIADGLIDEFTIQWVEGAPGGGNPMLVLIQSEPFLGRRIFARTALRPEGPWSERKVIFEVPDPARDKRLMTYAAKGHAHLSRPGELLVSYVINSTDFWQVVGDPALYRPRFLRVPLEMLPPPPK